VMDTDASAERVVIGDGARLGTVPMIFTERSIGSATSRFHSATVSYIYRRSVLHTDRFACPHRRPV